MKAEIGKRYRHYKNGKDYDVLAIANHSETGEKLVIYQGDYDTDDLGPKPVFVRPQKMFEEQVEREGELTDRFTKLG